MEMIEKGSYSRIDPDDDDRSGCLWGVVFVAAVGLVLFCMGRAMYNKWPLTHNAAGRRIVSLENRVAALERAMAMYHGEMK